MAAIFAVIFPYNVKSTGGKLAAETEITQQQENKFETAIEIIKKYESLHSLRHWPLVGYGHKILPGEKFPRNRALTEKEADALLRKDLQKYCALFRSYGKDSLLLATLAYNIGNGAVNRSTVAKKLQNGDRDIRENYIAHSRYKGKVHATIRKRRIEEFDKLYVTEVEEPKLALTFPSFIPSDNYSKPSQLKISGTSC
ncbi:MAG: lysozyme [Bacteroidales bacterium]|nr:lysozyme [Bacteroidales bacterium]MBD5190924.1 lysozyme [Bacteroidales bacterium]